ncbi:MAG TPA: hypothetical protein VFU04_06870 [Solirubrobacterales bacterium]|nr:hypothetical protein [Solirubrobacterales bacterium]
MDVAVRGARSQLRMPPRPSLLGRGLPERLRSTSLALLGLVGAAGLVMVALIMQPGPPLVWSGPIPEPPHQPRASRLPAIAVAKPAGPRPTPADHPGTEDRSASEPQPSHASVPVEAPVGDPVPAGDPVLVTDSEPRGDSGAEHKQPTGKSPNAPSAAPTPAPAPVTAAPAPQPPTATTSTEPPPPPAPEPPPQEGSGQPGNGNAYGRGNGKGHGSTGTPPGLAVD